MEALKIADQLKLLLLLLLLLWLMTSSHSKLLVEKANSLMDHQKQGKFSCTHPDAILQIQKYLFDTIPVLTQQIQLHLHRRRSLNNCSNDSSKY